ncbi:MAG: tRNA (adenosine(37)-N6)-threonylcarbamoyltransferase complex ATPase subunit type 1 TsaE [Kiritimatiellae bacterium]|nr:tRNA (adenosine(37)-N6)-threonylcarbamoyltransferase complex ATPase subunit type 1 TsaE [Kiritimatiellia bacterium]
MNSEVWRHRVDRAGEMWDLAARLAARLTRGSVVALHGEMGAGKTTFAQGLAAALGIRQPVTSPTFTIALEYPLPHGGVFVHMDLYRLRHADEWMSTGIDDYIESGAIVAVEWPERAGAHFPREAWHVEISLTPPATGQREVLIWHATGDA